jgi:hypothetical protein
MQVFLDNGTTVMLPLNIHSVPSVLLVNDKYRVIVGEEIYKHFMPKVAVQNDIATNHNGEPEAYVLGAASNVVSEQYTFYGMTPDELSAKGRGGMRQMYNYVAAMDNGFSIPTPPDTYRPDKINEDSVEKLQQKRNEDLGFLTNNPPPGQGQMPPYAPPTGGPSYAPPTGGPSYAPPTGGPSYAPPTGGPPSYAMPPNGPSYAPPTGGPPSYAMPPNGPSYALQTGQMPSYAMPPNGPSYSMQTGQSPQYNPQISTGQALQYNPQIPAGPSYSQQTPSQNPTYSPNIPGLQSPSPSLAPMPPIQNLTYPPPQHMTQPPSYSPNIHPTQSYR